MSHRSRVRAPQGVLFALLFKDMIASSMREVSFDIHPFTFYAVLNGCGPLALTTGYGISLTDKVPSLW